MSVPVNSLDSNLNALTAITRRYFEKDLKDQIMSKHILLDTLKKGGRMKTIDGGSDIRVPVRYARLNDRGWYQGDETLSTNYNEKKTNLIFQWKQARATLTITEADRLKNNGSAQIIDHVASEVEAAKEDLLDIFATGLYSDGTDSESIVGSRVFVSQSSTYGGISQASESWLQAQLDSVTTNITLAKMQEMYQNCKVTNQVVDLIVTDESEYNAVWASIQPAQRFSDKNTADAGFTNLLFNSAKLVEDGVYCPDGYMYFFNTKTLQFKSHSERDFPGKMEPWIKPTNQDVRVQHLFWMGAFVCDEPRQNGVMTALND